MRKRGADQCGHPSPQSCAFRVWLPSWRLAPRESLPDFVSLRRRSWGSPFGAFPSLRVSRHSCRNEPTCRSPLRRLSSKTESRWKGSLRRLLGFDPPTSPSLPSRARRPARNRVLPWVSALLGSFLPQPCAGFHRPSSHALGLEGQASFACASEYPSAADQGHPQGRPSPFRVPAPFKSRTFRRPRFRAMGSPRSGHRITAIGATALWNLKKPCRG